jgi:hypothetical protein
VSGFGTDAANLFRDTCFTRKLYKKVFSLQKEWLELEASTLAMPDVTDIRSYKKVDSSSEFRSLVQVQQCEVGNLEQEHVCATQAIFR